VPKAFSLLPVQRLQSRSVEFQGTALCSFFTEWLPGEMEQLAKADGALEEGRYEEADADAPSPPTYFLGEVARPAESSSGGDAPSPTTYFLGEVARPAERSFRG